MTIKVRQWEDDVDAADDGTASMEYILFCVNSGLEDVWQLRV